MFTPTITQIRQAAKRAEPTVGNPVNFVGLNPDDYKRFMRFILQNERLPYMKVCGVTVFPMDTVEPGHFGAMHIPPLPPLPRLGDIPLFHEA